MNAQQQAALEFYACAKNWERPRDWKTNAPMPSRIMVDGGSFARRALEPSEVLSSGDLARLSCTCELCREKLSIDHTPEPVSKLATDFVGGPA